MWIVKTFKYVFRCPIKTNPMTGWSAWGVFWNHCTHKAQFNRCSLEKWQKSYNKTGSGIHHQWAEWLRNPHWETLIFFHVCKKGQNHLGICAVTTLHQSLFMLWGYNLCVRQQPCMYILFCSVYLSVTVNAFQSRVANCAFLGCKEDLFLLHQSPTKSVWTINHILLNCGKDVSLILSLFRGTENSYFYITEISQHVSNI